MSDGRRIVAAFSASLIVLTVAWGGILAVDAVTQMLPEFLRGGVAALGSVAALVLSALAWWRVYIWLEGRL